VVDFDETANSFYYYPTIKKNIQAGKAHK